jgi:hypothetical protein
MLSTTLTVAIIGTILVLWLRPARAFAAYIAVLFLYPTYLVVGIGTLDIPASRIVVTVLLLRCLANSQLRSRFKWRSLDTWVTVYMAVDIVVMCLTSPLMPTLENRAGFMMDTWFAYMAARLCITNRAALITALKWISIALVPVVLSGILEMLQVSKPYAGLEQYCPWLAKERITIMRYGLARAKGAFGHPIMFGVSFAIFLPAVYWLRHHRGDWRILAYVLSVAVAIGGLSSMSSGPWMAIILAILCLAMERYKKLVKPILIGCALSCVLIGIISNRPFYHVFVSYANPLGGAAWHRAKMIDCAIRDFDKWYLAGYRGQDPGWGRDVGMGRTDLTNQYIGAGVRSGIWGFIVFCAMLVVAIKTLVNLHNSSSEPIMKSWAWALGSALVAMMISFMGILIFSQTNTLFYGFLGIVGCSSNLVQGSILLPQRIAVDHTARVPGISRLS